MYFLLLTAVFLIYFPIFLQFQGFDAFTTGTLFIYFLFVCFFLKRQSLFRGTHFARVILFLILIGLVSTLSIDSEFTYPSLRRYIAAVAGFLLFYLVININVDLSSEAQKERAERLLSIVLFMFTIQFCIGIAIYFVPSVGNYFSIFTTRDLTGVTTHFTDGGIKRMSAIMVGQESLGEIVAMLTPIVLYKILVKKSYIYYLILAIYFIAVTLSATRSGFLLFFFALGVYALSVLPMIKIPTWGLFVVGLAIAFPLAFFQFPELFAPILSRLSEFLDVYSKTESLAVATNRQGVWSYVLLVLLPNISLFGNGYVSIYNGGYFDFHNVYATVIHRYGVVGSVFFFYIFYKLIQSLLSIRKLCSNQSEKALVYACLTSIILLLINEVKFDFIRQASYQQAVWTLLGTYYLVFLSIRNKSLEKRTSPNGNERIERPQGLLARHNAKAGANAN